MKEGDTGEEQPRKENSEESKEETTESEQEVLAQTKLEGLASELEQTKQEVAKWQTEAKAHQKNVSKKSEELEKQQNLEGRLEVLTEMVADIVDRSTEAEDYEEPKQRKSEKYTSKLKEQETRTGDTTTQAEQQHFRGLAQEADGLIKSVGLDMEESPELHKAFVQFVSKGDPERGLEEVKKVVNKMTEAKSKETEEQLVKRIREEELKKILQERGELDAETGLPSATVGSWEQIRDAYSKNPDDARTRETYLKARRERGI